MRLIEGSTVWWYSLAHRLSRFLQREQCPHCHGETLFGDYWTDERAQRAIVVRCRTCGESEFIVTQPAGQQGVTWHRPELARELNT